MREKSSFPFRCHANPEDRMSTSAVAQDLQACVRLPASPVRPGETVGAQMQRSYRAAFTALPWWRFKAAWYGEAGCFSAAAAHQVQQLFLTWREREQARATERARTADIVAQQRDRDALRAARDEYRRTLAKLELRLAQFDDEVLT